MGSSPTFSIKSVPDLGCVFDEEYEIYRDRDKICVVNEESEPGLSMFVLDCLKARSGDEEAMIRALSVMQRAIASAA